MSYAATTAPAALPDSLKKEPWGIWASLVFVLALLVLAVVTFGVAGLVFVMVPAAIGMIVLLSLIVFG